MPKINVLPKSIAELIAAGEVVERPASVVKELIENSIDAASTAVTVEIKNGGRSYIRVTDNGCGISSADVRTAFISHATSKIKTQADLDSIFTLGFRGEALPSIAAVSRLSMLTKTQDELFGTGIELEGTAEQSFSEAGCPNGTTVIVRDLFFNTPARMKFLKRDITEASYVNDIVAKTAISHPEIKFSFIKDGKQTLSTPGDGDLYSVIYAVFGKDTAEGLIPCEYEINSIKISGFISKPLSNRPNRNMQYFYVNGRFVRLPVAAPALDEAYKNRIMVGKFPACFLFITIPAGTIDVNVHPAKTEIRFSDDRAVFEAIYYAARSALAKGDTVRPSVKLEAKKDILEKPVPQAVQTSFSPAPVNKTAEKTAFEISEQERGRLIEKLNSTQNMALFRDGSSVFENINPPEKRQDKFGNPVVIPAEKTESVPVSGVEISTAPEIHKEPAPVQGPEFHIIGEAFKTYILVEVQSKLLIIDKHAAHERMIFNRLSKKSGKSGSQLLLAPVAVTLTPREHAAVIENLSVFSQGGYLVEDFGSNAVVVRECPVELQNEDVSQIVSEIAGELLRGNLKPEPEKLEWLYHSTACRAAVKAGDDMKPQETEAFVRELLSDDSVRYCPHGRPVYYELKKHEIEKQFGRLG